MCEKSTEPSREEQIRRAFEDMRTTRIELTEDQMGPRGADIPLGQEQWL